MQNHKSNKPSPLVMILGIAGLVLALGGGAAWWAKYSLENKKPVTPNSNNLPQIKEPPLVPESSPSTQLQRPVTICWLNPTTNQIELVSKTLKFPQSVEPEIILQTAFEQLLAGPSQSANYTTTIPDGTKILALTTTEEGIKVNLSQEFVTGGGSASMISRLAQIIYTATSLDSKDQVWISVEGKPLNNLGGEGVIVNQPMTRQDFEANFKL